MFPGEYLIIKEVLLCSSVGDWLSEMKIFGKNSDADHLYMVMSGPSLNKQNALWRFCKYVIMSSKKKNTL